MTDAALKTAHTQDEAAALCEIFQNCLIQGWEEFANGPDMDLFSDYYDHLLETGFYESKFRNQIPNPAYDNAVKMIGKYVLNYAREHQIIFDDLFPGDFRRSIEYETPDHECRRFTLKAYKDGSPYCLFSIIIAHYHDRFGFASAPHIEVVEVY